MVDDIPIDEVVGKSNRLFKKGTAKYLSSLLFGTGEQASVMKYSKCIMPRVLQNIFKV